MQPLKTLNIKVTCTVSFRVNHFKGHGNLTIGARGIQLCTREDRSTEAAAYHGALRFGTALAIIFVLEARIPFLSIVVPSSDTPPILYHAIICRRIAHAGECPQKRIFVSPSLHIRPNTGDCHRGSIFPKDGRGSTTIRSCQVSLAPESG